MSGNGREAAVSRLCPTAIFGYVFNKPTALGDSW
jgi:hypothetical protein